MFRQSRGDTRAVCLAVLSQASLQRQIAGELEWLNQNAKGQQKKGKARLRRYEDLVEEVHFFIAWLVK